MRLALHCKVFAIAGSEKRSAWTSAKFLELPSTLMLRFSASNFAEKRSFSFALEKTDSQPPCLLCKGFRAPARSTYGIHG